MDKIASCEPSLHFRQQIQNDLNIKGQLSLPQAIDMRAILPVYAFSPSEAPTRAWFASGIFPCANFVNFNIDVLPVGVNLNGLRYLTLRGLFIHIDVDQAGRAVLAAAAENIHCTLLHFTSFFINYVIANANAVVPVNAAVGLYAELGSFITTKMPNIAHSRQLQWDQEFINIVNYDLLPGEFLEVFVGLDATQFPLNSFAYVNAFFDCHY